MNYNSTRNSKLSLSSAECFVRGISAEGGLFVPTEYPQLSLEQIGLMAEQNYRERAFTVLSRYLTDFSADEIKDCIDRAYASFDCNEVVPLKILEDNLAVMELFHGPTLAFKDVALQILPHFLRYARTKTGEKCETMILVATSGDTGKAALEGFCDVEGMRISVFFPNDGVSKMQQLQMTTQTGKNVDVCAVNGNFDDAQTGVKNIFADEDVKKELLGKNIKLSSANSINWGRLVPQLVYYFSAYADLLKNKKIALGDKVNFVVPTGNFGDILAGYFAKKMGLPVGKLICASNKNKVLTDFFATGEYNANREFYKTSSPSMDIVISSNLERLLYLTSKDDSYTESLMASLKKEGKYTVEKSILDALKQDFGAGFADENATSKTIKNVWDKYGYCIDTHTAVGMSVYSDLNDDTPTVVLSTASPYKFPHSVLTAINGSAPTDEFDCAYALEKMGVAMPESIKELKNKPILHKNVCEKQNMKKYILKSVK